MLYVQTLNDLVSDMNPLCTLLNFTASTNYINVYVMLSFEGELINNVVLILPVHHGYLKSIHVELSESGNGTTRVVMSAQRLFGNQYIYHIAIDISLFENLSLQHSKTANFSNVGHSYDLFAVGLPFEKLIKILEAKSQIEFKSDTRFSISTKQKG